MRVRRNKIYYINGLDPCTVIFKTDDDKVVVRRTEPNVRGEVSGTEFVPVELLTENPR